MKRLEQHSTSAADMEALGAQLAVRLGPVRRIYLHGPLGAGKTTWVRGLLHGLGHRGAVKSPTFTLVEPYPLTAHTVYHFDLYRLQQPEELEFLGIRDYLADRAVCVVEWAEKAAGVLPEPDIDVKIEPVNKERRVELTAHTHDGVALLSRLT
jgi:tRNA threonylcarbamoyladenosine biosynthesis protein TsaE